MNQHLRYNPQEFTKDSHFLSLLKDYILVSQTEHNHALSSFNSLNQKLLIQDALAVHTAAGYVIEEPLNNRASYEQCQLVHPNQSTKLMVTRIKNSALIFSHTSMFWKFFQNGICCLQSLLVLLCFIGFLEKE